MWFPPHHKSSMNLPKMVKNTGKNTFWSGRGPNSWCIGNGPLYFHQMILSMVFGLKMVFPDHKMALSLTTKLPELSEIFSKSPKNAFCPGRGPGSFCIGNTAGLAMDCRVGLHWHFRCGCLILKPRPVLDFSPKKSCFLIYSKSQKWARTAENDVFKILAKNWWFSNNSSDM